MGTPVPTYFPLTIKLKFAIATFMKLLKMFYKISLYVLYLLGQLQIKQPFLHLLGLGGKGVGVGGGGVWYVFELYA